MATFVDKLPMELLTKIANYVDLQTVPYLQATCKLACGYADNDTLYTRVVEDTATKLQQVVDLVTEFHNTMHQDPKVKAELTTALQKAFLQYAEQHRNPTDFTLSELRRFTEYAECFIDDAVRVWIASANGRAMPEEDEALYKALQDYLVRNSYSFAFQYMDRKEVSTYYTHGYISFNENGQCEMQFCIQDIKNGKDIGQEHKEAISKIPTAYLDSDGLIQLKVSPASINELARFVVDTFGLDNAMYKTDMVSYIKPSSRLNFPRKQEVFETVLKMDMDVWRDRFIDILDGN